MQILYKDRNLIAVYKEAGIPSQPDPTGDSDAMTLLSELLTSENEKNELYLLHRLDRVVGGVLVFARNKKYAAILSALISEKEAQKEYLAVVCGDANGGIMEDLLYKDARAGKAFVVDRKRAGVKDARLEYSVIGKVTTEKGIYSLVKIRLHTGRFHQIRVQFSSRKMPIIGDRKYGSADGGAKMPALFAARLSFTAEGKRYDFEKMPDKNSYPWNLFGDLL
jgi:23S rRNA pseudouridine1911/1915/1917 synthase